MAQEQKDLKDKGLKDHSIVSDKIWRDFVIYINEETRPRIGDMMIKINYCPKVTPKIIK